MRDHDLYYFQLGTSTRLELIEYDKKADQAIFSTESPGVYRHIALQVTDIFQWERHLKSKGVTVPSSPSWIDELQSTSMLIFDPNGVEIELIERFS